MKSIWGCITLQPNDCRQFIKKVSDYCWNNFINNKTNYRAKKWSGKNTRPWDMPIRIELDKVFDLLYYPVPVKIVECEMLPNWYVDEYRANH